MQWQKAKNIILGFLIAVNVILFFLITNDNARYKLSALQEMAIINVLKREQIELNTDISLLNFSPMKRLALKPQEINHKEVLSLFFDNIEELEQEQAGERFVYTNHLKTQFLTIQNSSFEYDYYNDVDIIDFTKPTEEILVEAKKLTDEFILKMGDLAKGFELDVFHHRVGDLDLINAVYRFSYNSIIIYPNEISFTITKNGIRAIEYSFFEPTFYDGDKRGIFSPDEVLLRFMIDPVINNLKPVIINNIDIVYYFKETDLNEEVIYALPTYRINYTSQTRTFAEFFIDAYSNEAR